jgi:hypothetical protein
MVYHHEHCQLVLLVHILVYCIYKFSHHSCNFQSTTTALASKNMASALKGLSKGAQIGISVSLLAAILE